MQHYHTMITIMAGLYLSVSLSHLWQRCKDEQRNALMTKAKQHMSYASTDNEHCITCVNTSCVQECKGKDLMSKASCMEKAMMNYATLCM